MSEPQLVFMTVQSLNPSDSCIGILIRNLQVLITFDTRKVWVY